MHLLDGYLQAMELSEESKEAASTRRKKLVNSIMSDSRIDSDGVKQALSDTLNKLQYQHINDVLSKLEST